MGIWLLMATIVSVFMWAKGTFKTCQYDDAWLNTNIRNFMVFPELFLFLACLVAENSRGVKKYKKDLIFTIRFITWSVACILPWVYFTDITVQCKIEPHSFHRLLFLMIIYSVIFPIHYVKNFSAFIITYCLAPLCLTALYLATYSSKQQFQFKKKFIKALSKFTYGFIKIKSKKECGICLKVFDDDQMVSIVSCTKKHYFHTKCIEHWLKN